MSQRFFHPKAIHPTESIELAESESHHLIHVMRAKIGDALVLFDGSGSEFPALIESISRKSVTVSVVARNEVNRELGIELVIACPLPKSDRQKFLIEKLTELGATRWIPMITQRASVVPKDKSLEKLNRLVIEASKQCGRNRLMKIGDPLSLPELLNKEGDLKRSSATNGWIAHPAADRSQSIQPDRFPGTSHSIFLIGPEGGFTPEEFSMASNAGWQPLQLGKTILRMETAAIACAAVVAIGQSGPPVY